jgi:uncharacterized protein YuzE
MKITYSPDTDAPYIELEARADLPECWVERRGA